MAPARARRARARTSTRASGRSRSRPRSRRSELAARLATRRAPVKAAILDQRTLAGVGNIYADEALWRARIHPLREARSLEPTEVRALHKAIRKALELGIARQGSTLRDYALPDGGSGGMQHEFKVYGRAGEPCERCGTPIEQDPSSAAAAPGTARAASSRRSISQAAAPPRLATVGRTYKTEAVVLRSLRFSEADRILHLYTRDRGRIGAIAKGIRKTKSRFGARLEPLSHVELMLHEGSGELQTVTGVDADRARTTRRARTATGSPPG